MQVYCNKCNTHYLHISVVFIFPKTQLNFCFKISFKSWNIILGIEDISIIFPTFITLPIELEFVWCECDVLATKKKTIMANKCPTRSSFHLCHSWSSHMIFVNTSSYNLIWVFCIIVKNIDEGRSVFQPHLNISCLRVGKRIIYPIPTPDTPPPTPNS